MIDRTHSLPVTRQCRLLSLNRPSVHYQPLGVSDEDLRLMRCQRILDSLWRWKGNYVIFAQGRVPPRLLYAFILYFINKAI